MKREDLRNKIIPTTIENTDEYQENGNPKFKTTDLIYIDSFDDQFDFKKKDIERRTSATDYAKMNNALTFANYRTRTGRETTYLWLRSAGGGYDMHCVGGNGRCCANSTSRNDVGLCPSLHYYLSPDISIRRDPRFFKWKKSRYGNKEAEQYDIRRVKNTKKRTIYHTLQIGEYPKTKVSEDLSSTMWQNSSIRGFLNGIDVRNIRSNGNIKYGANFGGNFVGECNFLNEAFNLSREPIVEYTIPDSETEIPDDAFNGCITLKKLAIHSKVTSIGKRAFEGLHFKYAYKTRIGQLILSEELPKNKYEYQDIIELDKIIKSLDEFDYSILIQTDKLSKLINLAETLSKNNFSIPYAYGYALIKSEKEKSFCENSDFRFFKNEMSKINEMLLNFPEEEKIDFFKFASALGCFSKEKILDKNGKETQAILAQKTSSLLAQLLKTGEMRLRSISSFICFNATGDRTEPRIFKIYIYTR